MVTNKICSGNATMAKQQIIGVDQNTVFDDGEFGQNIAPQTESNFTFSVARLWLPTRAVTAFLVYIKFCMGYSVLKIDQQCFWPVNGAADHWDPNLVAGSWFPVCSTACFYVIWNRSEIIHLVHASMLQELFLYRDRLEDC
jgi:hypothetical protein